MSTPTDNRFYREPAVSSNGGDQMSEIPTPKKVETMFMRMGTEVVTLRDYQILERDLTAARERLAECEKERDAEWTARRKAQDDLLTNQAVLATLLAELTKLKAESAARDTALREVCQAVIDARHKVGVGPAHAYDIAKRNLTTPATDPIQPWREVVEALVKAANGCAEHYLHTRPKEECPLCKLVEATTRAEALLKGTR